MRFGPDSVSRDHRAPPDAQHPGRLVGEHLQSLGPSVGRGDVIDELQFPVRLEQPGMWADGVDVDAVELFGRGDEHVGHRARRQFDHQIVDRVASGAFDNVEGQDVGAYRTERHGQ